MMIKVVVAVKVVMIMVVTGKVNSDRGDRITTFSYVK